MIHDIYIGQSHWQLDAPDSMNLTEEAIEFSKANSDSPKLPSLQFKLVPSIRLPGVGGKPNAFSQIRRIYLQEGLEAREHLIADTGEVYAVYAEIGRNAPLIFLDANRPDLFLGDSFLFNYMAIERNLLLDDQIILHSCFIIHQGEAILFTAPSETGKSTQGNHWAKLFGSVVVNGDRALLGKHDGVWKAYGSPFCGTSGICKNLQAPIKAIVYLHQAPENKLERITGFSTFHKLYEQTTVNHWNPDFPGPVIDLLLDLIEKVPVYEYWLTKEEESAEYLKSCLY